MKEKKYLRRNQNKSTEIRYVINAVLDWKNPINPEDFLQFKESYEAKGHWKLIASYLVLLVKIIKL